SLQATAFQLFVKSSSQWSARPFAPGEVEAFRDAAHRGGMTRHSMAHASYLINLASPDDALWRRSVLALRLELERCAALGVPYLVVHPGSRLGTGRERGLRRIARALDAALEPERPGSPRAGLAFAPTILLETTAGQGGVLGSTFEELGLVLDAVDRDDRVG